jgi:hypothetical protein
MRKFTSSAAMYKYASFLIAAEATCPSRRPYAALAELPFGASRISRGMVDRAVQNWSVGVSMRG